MQILQMALVILFFVSCGALVFLILIQSGKGGSLGVMGGGGSASPFGSSTVDVVEKATWYGIAAFLVLAVLSAVTFADQGIKITPTDTETEIPADLNTHADESEANPQNQAAPANNQPTAPIQVPVGE